MAFHRYIPRFVTLALVVATLAVTSASCAALPGKIRLNAADQRFDVGRFSGPSLSVNTTQTLRENALAPPANFDALMELRAYVMANTTSDLLSAYSETAYLYARKVEKSRPLQAQRLYADVVLFTWHYLFNPTLSNARDRATWNGQLSDAVVLYNGASERFLHLALVDAFERDDSAFPFVDGQETPVQCESGPIRTRLQIDPGVWRPEEYGEFRVAADCAVDSLSFDCRQSGFGVPLVVERRAASESSAIPRTEERYYPPSILFPATAVLRPNPSAPLGTLPALGSTPLATFDSADFTLEILDPLVTNDLVQAGSAFPLETDLTTPLAYFLSTHDKLASKAARRSLLRPEALQETVTVAQTQEERQLQGLYLLEPYDPNKIPVVMTHGLASSPVTWMEMYNALRSVQGFQHGYQFMFFFYPTGQPFWASAATLRHELREFRDVVDPNRTAGALDATVLIGHSMGGLISRMQVQSSGDRIWNLVSSKPVDAFDFDAEARRNIDDWFFFEPNPSVKRVITIATPFRGSKFANTFTNWLSKRAIAAPQTIASVLGSTAGLVSGAKGRQGDFDPTMLTIATSVESLDPNCPIFQVLNELPIPPDVALDNIVGVVPQLENRVVNPKKSDGVVEYESAHLENAEQETVAPAPHTVVHAHFDTINQVRDILSRHLALNVGRNGNAPARRSATFPSFGPRL